MQLHGAPCPRFRAAIGRVLRVEDGEADAGLWCNRSWPEIKHRRGDEAGASEHADTELRPAPPLGDGLTRGRVEFKAFDTRAPERIVCLVHHRPVGRALVEMGIPIHGGGWGFRWRCAVCAIVGDAGPRGGGTQRLLERAASFALPEGDAIAALAGFVIEEDEFAVLELDSQRSLFADTPALRAGAV